jgi:hypothetical protein
MASLSPARQTPRLILKTQLHGFVAVSFLTSNLQDVTWTSLNHGNGNNPTVFQINLCHPDFPAEN